MAGAFRSTTPELLPELLAAAVLTMSLDRPVRVAVDGPACAPGGELAAAVAERVRRAGRPAVVVAAAGYWRDASLRLEYGRTDPVAYFDWLDRAALIREVLEPLGPGGTRRYLPALRDSRSNRSARARYATAAPDEVVLVHGDLLLVGHPPFDHTIHVALTPAARARRTPPDWAWTLPALDRYDAEVDPVATAATVISWNDPARPAVRSTRDGPADRMR